jgi:hypothetical protein
MSHFQSLLELNESVDFNIVIDYSWVQQMTALIETTDKTIKT